MKSAQWKMNSQIGPLYLVASDRGLQGVHWKKQKLPLAPTLKSREARFKILAKAVAQLDEYFAARRKSFDLPLDMQGSEFQKRVWKALSRIPYGRTLSYKDIARKLKHERAVRAVGTANGKNPLSIVIPCHRVIASNGSLAGYAGGLAIKAQLLALEQSYLDKS
jgi:methylated-DNA-[protein]-cysteine S-methyltransferase